MVISDKDRYRIVHNASNLHAQVYLNKVSVMHLTMEASSNAKSRRVRQGDGALANGAICCAHQRGRGKRIRSAFSRSVALLAKKL